MLTESTPVGTTSHCKVKRKRQSDSIKMDVMVMWIGLHWSRSGPVVQITTVVSSLYLVTERLRG